MHRDQARTFMWVLFFFFQAEDGIRDVAVTGVQTCALPIWLFAASALAVLLAHAAGLFLIAQEREHFVLQGSVREWSRRIAEITFALQAMSPAERVATIGRLSSQPGSPPAAWLHHGEPHEHGWSPEHGHPPDPPHALRHHWSSPLIFIHLPLLSDFEPTLREQLRTTLGTSYGVSVSPTA